MDNYNNFDDMQIDIKGMLSRFWKSGGLKWLLVLIVVIFLVVAGATSVYTVQTEGEAVLKRFGKVVAIKQPGLHFKLPFGIDKAYFVPTRRVLKEEFGFRTAEAGQRTRYERSDMMQQESLMLTGDLNVINLEWVVQYQIIQPDDYLHQVRNPTETLRDIAEAVIRRITGNRLGREVLTVERTAVAQMTREEMQEILDRYNSGISIQAVKLQDVTPPEKVKPAFNDVNEARQERERLINEAEKYRNQMIPKAKGEAEQTVAEAEAYRAERVNEAEGDASRFDSIRKQYVRAEGVTRRRLYLEALEKVIPAVGKIYVTDGEGSGKGEPLPLLHLNEGDLKRGSKQD